MPITKPCNYCGKDVTRPKSHILEKVYCNRECYKKEKQDRNSSTKTCENCGIEFNKAPKNTWEFFKNQRFCNHKCYSDSLKGKTSLESSARMKELWRNPEFKEKMLNRPAHSEETKRKIGIAFKGRKLTDEHKLKISKAVKGVNHPLYGKKMPPEAIRKMSEKKSGKPLSEKHKKYLSKLFTGRRLSESTRKKLSDITKDKWANDRQFVEKVLAGLSNKEGTSIERKVAKILEELNIEFEKQKVISRSIVDFYIPNGNKIIEADGDYWHNLPGAKERDLRRDSFLKDKGYRILRITETEINDNPIPKIKDFLKL